MEGPKDIKGYVKAQQDRVNERLEQLLPNHLPYLDSVSSAMRYATLAKGKRLRPILALTVGDLAGGRSEEVLVSACAVEMIHACSLILDDLPAMDDARMRRGRPACHVQYGEGMALLAADALLNLAYEVVLDDLIRQSCSSRTISAVICELSRAVGTDGMIAGQIVDLASLGEDASYQILVYIHSHKTGALFEAAVRVAGILTEAPEGEIRAISKYAEHLGLAFQITDDILDELGQVDVLNKDHGQDRKNNKVTFLSLLGMERAHEKVVEEVDLAKASLKELGDRAALLAGMADFIAQRTCIPNAPTDNDL